MANLTAKELDAISDQLNFEKMMVCKYQTAQQTSSDASLQRSFSQYASQHRENYENLLQFLK